MHAAAYRWLRNTIAQLDPKPQTVIEIGSRDINGSPRPLLVGTNYTGVDYAEGRGVDVVADGTTYTPEEPADMVICAEVLEHVQEPRPLVENLVACAKAGGDILITCATRNRAPHSAHDGGPLRVDEHYRNISLFELREWLEGAGATVVDISENLALGDLYARATAPASKPKAKKAKKR
jgi:hypothetical protein